MNAGLTVASGSARTAAASLIIMLAGCSLLDEPRLHISVRNNTEAPAVVQMVEFDFASGDFGAPLGAATAVPGGGTARLGVPIPAVKDWALRINDLPAVTSRGLTDDDRYVSGDGQLVFSTSVDDGGLSTSVRRGTPAAGETFEAAPN